MSPRTPPPRRALGRSGGSAERTRHRRPQRESQGSPTDVQSLLVLDGNLYGAANGGASSFGLYRLGDASQTAAATPWRSISGPGYGDPATYWYSVIGYDVGGVTTLLLSAGNLYGWRLGNASVRGYFRGRLRHGRRVERTARGDR